MTTFESPLTPGNFTLGGKRPHVYITPFLHAIPRDAIGGSTRYDLPARLIRLDFGTLTTETFVPTDKRSGKPRYFFQDRLFVREVFSRTDAGPGDTVLFEQLTPYHYRLSLRKPSGIVLSK